MSDGHVETAASSVDASLAGLGLRSTFLWEPGTCVTVRLVLSDRTTAVARAIVQRADGDVMGLSLVATGPMFSRLLHSLERAA